MKTIKILFSVMLTSFFMNHPDTEVHVYLLHNDLTSSDQAYLTALGTQYHNTIHYLKIDNSMLLQYTIRVNLLPFGGNSLGKEMEGILGISARHATANFNAFQQLAWPQADMDILLTQWGVNTGKDYQYTMMIDGEEYLYEIDEAGVKHLYGVREIPQIAGSYITGREVENAYRTVINNNVNAKETLYKYAQNINNEIDRKRSEFGLPLKDEE